MKNMYLNKTIAVGFLGLSVMLQTGCSVNTNVSETQTSIQESQNVESTMETDDTQNSTSITYDAMLVQDQPDMCRINVTIADEPYLQVFDEDGKEIFKREFLQAYSLGDACYLVKKDGQQFLMTYYALVDHDEALTNFECFNFDVDGNKNVIDSGSMELGFYEYKDFDKNAWLKYADHVNGYFDDAVLLVSTREGVLSYSSKVKTSTYHENFSWVTGDASKDSASNIDKMMKEVKDNYSD